MKKVKIMLTAVVVMAVVGGALAFKAKKGGESLCIYTTTTTTTNPADGSPVGTCDFSTRQSVAGLTSLNASLFITTRPTINDECPTTDPATGVKYKDCTLFSTTFAE